MLFIYGQVLQVVQKHHLVRNIITGCVERITQAWTLFRVKGGIYNYAGETDVNQDRPSRSRRTVTQCHIRVEVS